MQNYQLNHKFTSDLTPLPVHLIFLSPRIQHAPIFVHIQLLELISISLDHHLPQDVPTLMTSSIQSLPMQTIIFSVMNVLNLAACTNLPLRQTHLSMATTSSVNSMTKTWSFFHSPLTHGDDLDQCYRHSSQPRTTHHKNHGTPHIGTINTFALMQILCTNEHHTHHALLEYSPQLTSTGVNLPLLPAGFFLVTPTRLLHPAFTVFNNLDLQSQKPSAHSYVQLPVRSVSQQQPPCSISIRFSLLKIHTP